jgi:uroporphyrinogen decarboxylase
LYETTDYCIACGEVIQDLQEKHGGRPAWWMRLASEPQVCHEFLEKATEAAIAQLRQLEQAIGRYCEILTIGDDIGDQRGVTIGPDLWREIYKPHYARLFTEWHKITKMKVSLHSCGAIADVLPDLVECGVDIYNPVQISANRMDPETLKGRFGKDLIFYGGSYDSVCLPPDTPAEAVHEAVGKNIRILSRGGGYIFAGVHNLPADTPKSHLRAILAAYRDCRSAPGCLPASA